MVYLVMKRLGFELHVLILLVLLSSCKETTPPVQETITPKKPNIVLILADDQGWGDLGHSGNTNLNTPNIDAIAKNGVSLENFFVQPVCSPTRAELLTGRYFTRLGVYDTSAGGERINLGETTLAEVFKKAGYATAAYGKWHNGMQPPYHPNARGFDDFYGFASGHWGNYFSPMLEHNGGLVQGEGYLTDDLTNHGMEFITKHRNEPFLLYLPYNIPHSPMQVPDQYWDRFKDKALEQKYPGPEIENENFTRAALAMVENIDFNVGRVMAKLRELDLEEDTIVIYLSDNGPNGWRYNGNMRGKKGSPDEGGVRSPFFIQWKNKLPAGKTVSQITGSIDLLPTLTALAQIPCTTLYPIDGKDISGLLQLDSVLWAPRLLYNHWNGNTSVRAQNYRLDQQDQLYDMVNDHGQTTDISAQFPVMTDSLRQAKVKWLETTISDSSDRGYTMGYEEFAYTQIPARDGIPHGNIKRSNRHPNDTFFTNWKSEKDSITWDIDVLADGEFEVTLYYTCKLENVGCSIQMNFGDSTLDTKITEAHDPPLEGMENDRDPRIESCTKDFKALPMGNIRLKKGRGPLTLKAMKIPGKGVIDLRLLMFRRI